MNPNTTGLLYLVMTLSACGGGGSSSTAQQQDSPPAINQSSVDTNRTTAPVSSSVADALRTGDSSLTSMDDLLSDAITMGQQDLDNCVNTLETIYPRGPIENTMPYLANYTYSSRRKNYPLHVAADTGAAYSWIGEQEDGTRYAYFGASIFHRSDSEYWGNLGITEKDTTLDVMTWITQNPDRSALLNSRLRIAAVTRPARRQLEKWLDYHNINTLWTITSDEQVVSSGAFDLLIGMAGETISAVSDALESKKPVMLWSEVFDPGGAVSPLGLSWAWWGEQTVGNADSVQSQCDIAFPGKSILTTFRSLKDELLDFDYTEDACPVSVFTTECQADILRREDGTNFHDAFLAGAEALKLRLERFDFGGTSVFTADSSALMTKLAVLIGDKLRQQITFPLDKVVSSPVEFFGAYLADHTQHYARDYAIPQMDAGTFGEDLDGIAAKTSDSTTVKIRPTSHAEWSSTGMTGKAGQPVTLTRLDNNPAQISVRFNMIRSRSTWEWNTNGYNRPKFVTSNQVIIPANSTATITSPIGGPLYVHWEGQPASASDFEVKFEGAVKHPFLSLGDDASDDASIAEFTAALLNDDFDWVDIKTPYAEVHSLADRMITAFNIQNGTASDGFTNTDIRNWISDLNTWLMQSSLGLAGYVGEGLPALKSGVAEFCRSHNLQCDDVTLHKSPPVQHINADQNASCGDLCSGNPFDLNSYVKPLAFGESHEMGHNLQRFRFNFYDRRSSETSNNIFPHYSAYRWQQDQNLEVHPTRRLPDPEKAYNQLQSSIGFGMTPNVGHPIWADGRIYVNADVRLTLYLQLVYIHDQQVHSPGSDADGWDLYTKLYKLERQYTEALNDDATWLAQRDRLGFSQYDRTDAAAIQGKEFMAIALSWITKADHRSYLNVWGVSIDPEASAQIDANGYDNIVPLVFWRSPDDRFIRTELPNRNPANAMPLDGVTSW